MLYDQADEIGATAAHLELAEYWRRRGEQLVLRAIGAGRSTCRCAGHHGCGAPAS